jgi:hypothetical protein
MPRRCTRRDCDCAVTIVDDNGVVDGTKTRIETYECARGHEFTITLEGRR